ncbi:hypothetical protein Pelo_420 [Pelomyxa schiedti]|nr:hypothetical protein Pelo_420 [Pelomyxa schiedti]
MLSLNDLREKKLVLACAGHARLGSNSPMSGVSGHLLKIVCDMLEQLELWFLDSVTPWKEPLVGDKLSPFLDPETMNPSVPFLALVEDTYHDPHLEFICNGRPHFSIDCAYNTSGRQMYLLREVMDARGDTLMLCQPQCLLTLSRSCERSMWESVMLSNCEQFCPLPGRYDSVALGNSCYAACSTKDRNHKLLLSFDTGSRLESSADYPCMRIADPRGSHIIFAGASSSSVDLFHIRDVDSAPKMTPVWHTNRDGAPCTMDMDRANGRFLAYSSGQSITVMDISEASPRQVWTAGASVHESTITTLKLPAYPTSVGASSSRTVLLSGDSTGVVCLWDTRFQSKPARLMRVPDDRGVSGGGFCDYWGPTGHSQSSSSSSASTGTCFFDRYAAVASSFMHLHVFDLLSGSVISDARDLHRRKGVDRVVQFVQLSYP